MAYDQQKLLSHCSGSLKPGSLYSGVPANAFWTAASQLYFLMEVKGQLALYPHDWITHQRPHLLIPSSWGLGFQHMNLRFAHNHSGHSSIISLFLIAKQIWPFKIFTWVLGHFLTTKGKDFSCCNQNGIIMKSFENTNNWVSRNYNIIHYNKLRD